MQAPETHSCGARQLVCLAVPDRSRPPTRRAARRGAGRAPARTSSAAAGSGAASTEASPSSPRIRGATIAVAGRRRATATSRARPCSSISASGLRKRTYGLGAGAPADVAAGGEAEVARRTRSPPPGRSAIVARLSSDDALSTTITFTPVERRQRLDAARAARPRCCRRRRRRRRSATLLSAPPERLDACATAGAARSAARRGTRARPRPDTGAGVSAAPKIRPKHHERRRIPVAHCPPERSRDEVAGAVAHVVRAAVPRRASACAHRRARPRCGGGRTARWPNARVRQPSTLALSSSTPSQPIRLRQRPDLLEARAPIGARRAANVVAGHVSLAASSPSSSS